jgi:signal peptidase I
VSSKEIAARVPHTKRSLLKSYGEYALFIAVALVVTHFVRAYVGQVFFIPSESMVPTLNIDDRIVVSRLSYRSDKPKHDDIIVFQNPGWAPPPQPALPIRFVKNLGLLVGIGQPEDKDFIKRVIGIPGDTIEGKKGHVFRNGTQLPEKYLPAGLTTGNFPLVTVPKGKYWVMGDNRGNSCDSRCLVDQNGKPAPFIAEDKIVGRAIFRIWPLTRIGTP